MLIRAAELMDVLTEYEANLPADGICPALSPAQWTARQAAACKVLFALYWLRQHPEEAEHVGAWTSFA